MKFIKGALIALSILGTMSQANADEDKILRVATEPSFAPFEFMDQQTSNLVGFDVDIINAFQGQDAIDIFKKLTVVNKKGE